MFQPEARYQRCTIQRCIVPRVHSLDACHKVVHDHVSRVSSLHLAVHILQQCSDELNDCNDEAAESDGAQVVSVTTYSNAHAKTCSS